MMMIGWGRHVNYYSYLLYCFVRIKFIPFLISEFNDLSLTANCDQLTAVFCLLKSARQTVSLCKFGIVRHGQSTT